MSTRSVICKETLNKTYVGIYCHSDGYPQWVGKRCSTTILTETELKNCFILAIYLVWKKKSSQTPIEYILLTTLRAMFASHITEIAVKSYDKQDQLSSTKLTKSIGQSLCTSICKMERGTLLIYVRAIQFLFRLQEITRNMRTKTNDKKLKEIHSPLLWEIFRWRQNLWTARCIR